MTANATDEAERDPGAGRRLAVIFNPTKVVDDRLFAAVNKAVDRHPGWERPIYLPTGADDNGRAATQQALRLGAELVLAAGGDGTVRAVTTVLQHSEVPCGIIPGGTGNLLARNLEIPLDYDRALDIVFAGVQRRIDLAQLVIDHDHDHVIHFTGMAGIGFDAAMMRDTDDRLKRVAGNVAYVVAFARHLNSRPRGMRMRIDDGDARDFKAVLMMVGNTSQLQGGLRLFPDARPDDGRLDVLVAAPTTLGKWARLVSAVLRRSRDPEVEYSQGSKIVFELDRPTECEADGDTEGKGTHFEFSVKPSALLVMAPPPRQ